MKKRSLTPYLRTPCVALYGNREVIMEGKFKLLDYTPERIVADVAAGRVAAVITGNELRLRVVGENVLSIYGSIASFGYTPIGGSDE